MGPLTRPVLHRPATLHLSASIVPSQPPARVERVLSALGIVRSAWYVKPDPEPARPGRKPQGVPAELAAEVRALAERYPWWGYKRIVAHVQQKDGAWQAHAGVMRHCERQGIVSTSAKTRARHRHAAISVFLNSKKRRRIHRQGG
jgi:hypothetical protein